MWPPSVWVCAYRLPSAGSLRCVARTALAYKIGELTIRQLRERAEEGLGSRFDIREFHDIVLRNGAMPLDLLQEKVDRYMAGTRSPAR
jgi:hypothetical protein